VIKLFFPRVHNWFVRLHLNYKMATTKPRPDVEVFAEAWADSDYEVRPEELVRGARRDWESLTLGERWRLNAYDMFVELQRVKASAAARIEKAEARIEACAESNRNLKAQLEQLGRRAP
jgi:hypothetical protein